PGAAPGRPPAAAPAAGAAPARPPDLQRPVAVAAVAAVAPVALVAAPVRVGRRAARAGLAVRAPGAERTAAAFATPASRRAQRGLVRGRQEIHQRRLEQDRPARPAAAAAGRLEQSAEELRALAASAVGAQP